MFLATVAASGYKVSIGDAAITAVLGFNFVGDGLRDALDPKGRR